MTLLWYTFDKDVPNILMGGITHMDAERDRNVIICATPRAANRLRYQAARRWMKPTDRMVPLLIDVQYGVRPLGRGLYEVDIPIPPEQVSVYGRCRR